MNVFMLGGPDCVSLIVSSVSNSFQNQLLSAWTLAYSSFSQHAL